MSATDLSEQLIEAVAALDGLHPHTRVLHAKGTWCEGTFTASAAATGLCRAAVMSGAPIPALVRFSNASGDPEGEDAERVGRGMAVKLGARGGGETDILAVATPAFVARNPADFLELMKLRKPDPETGQPDMERLGAYLGAHPEAGPAIQATIGAEPPASYATIPYNSPHAFRLLDAGGDGTWVRYRWRPDAGEQRIPDDDARAKGRDYLRAELAGRLASGSAGFTLFLQLAAEGDPLDDPTAIWSDERELVEAGHLALTAMVDDPESGGHIEVFDPTRVGDGIELSDDPILHARRGAYSVSAYHRLGER